MKKCIILVFLLSFSLLFSDKDYQIILINNLPNEHFLNADNRVFFLSGKRSGTHWSLYILKYFTQRPITQGKWYYNFCDQEIDFSKPFIHHFHNYNGIYNQVFQFPKPNKKNDKLITIVRNPVERVLRGVDKIENILSHVQKKAVKGLINELFKNLQIFNDWHEQRRYIFYYEDLIARPKEEIEKLLSFLEEDSEDLSLFIDDIEFHKQKCLSYYDNRFGTPSKGRSATFYSDQYSSEIIKFVTRYLKNKYPFFWDKYLKRYDSIPQRY